MSSFKITGLDEVTNSLKKLQNNVNELSNTKSVPFSDLFTKSFMRKCSSFSSFDELLSSGNMTANSQEEFDNIPDEKLDQYVSSVTSYKNFEEMLDSATEEYISNKLSF